MVANFSPVCQRLKHFCQASGIGLQVAYLVGGSLIVESIFALPGLGRYLTTAIYARDYAVIQGLITFIALRYVVVNFFVDLAYSTLDPRVRSGRAL